jgi:hypothetical protein
MREGLLWFDDDPRRRLKEKILQAAARYQRKFGAAPDVCYVSAQTFEQAGDFLPSHQSNGGLPSHVVSGGRSGIRVRPSTVVRPHHFWIGRELGTT